MNNDKPFWKTRNNPITGYFVESLKDVVDDLKLDREYDFKGRRYAKHTAGRKRIERELERCVILNSEE